MRNFTFMHKNYIRWIEEYKMGMVYKLQTTHDIYYIYVEMNEQMRWVW
jgi:hypothetical protein